MDFEYDFIRLIKDYLNDTLRPIESYAIPATDYESQNFRYGKFYISEKGKVMPEFRTVVSHVEHCEECHTDKFLSSLFEELDIASANSMLTYAALRDSITHRVGSIHTV